MLKTLSDNILVLSRTADLFHGRKIINYLLDKVISTETAPLAGKVRWDSTELRHKLFHVFKWQQQERNTQQAFISFPDLMYQTHTCVLIQPNILQTCVT